MRKQVLILYILACIIFSDLIASEVEILRVSIYEDWLKDDKIAKKIFQESARKNYKLVGIDYCLKYYELSSRYHADALIREVILKRGGGKEGIEEIKNFVEKIEKQKEEKNYHITRLESCLNLYDSKEYQDEVKRIVKKYCKDCK
ncbi:hypothetical protein [Helicobacter sp. MIT 14-3879]|uniref:hypothetical protein n=1 Tax=Helicobacter sp. MIT 14-3879 TaxID=2040649 RepID=UPI000E1EFB48|nr:hypothetical protein [Helicobacter sp. MIT 14-3879]RDU60233.1 hypothetical protein CQA44_10725 [Helicobacter sp. MIT 14-3879]